MESSSVALTKPSQSAALQQHFLASEATQLERLVNLPASEDRAPQYRCMSTLAVAKEQFEAAVPAGTTTTQAMEGATYSRASAPKNAEQSRAAAAKRPRAPLKTISVMCSPPPAEQVAAKHLRGLERMRQLPKAGKCAGGSDSGNPSAVSQDGERDEEEPKSDLAAGAEKLPTVYGIFHPDRYLNGEDCIDYQGNFITRSKFERLGGSLMAKWHRSIRVVTTDEPLGSWLTRRGLPVLKGNPRNRRLVGKDEDECARPTVRRTGAGGKGTKGNTPTPADVNEAPERSGEWDLRDPPPSAAAPQAAVSEQAARGAWGAAARASRGPSPGLADTPQGRMGGGTGGASEANDSRSAGLVRGAAGGDVPAGAPQRAANDDVAWGHPGTGMAGMGSGAFCAEATAACPFKLQRCESAAASCSASARTSWLPGPDDAAVLPHGAMRWAAGGFSPGSPQASSEASLQPGGALLAAHTDCPPGGVQPFILPAHQPGGAGSAPFASAAGVRAAVTEGGLLTGGAAGAMAGAGGQQQQTQPEISDPDWLSWAWDEYSGGEGGVLAAGAVADRPYPPPKCWPEQQQAHAGTDELPYSSGRADADGRDRLILSVTSSRAFPSRPEAHQQRQPEGTVGGGPNQSHAQQQHLMDARSFLLKDQHEQRLALPAQRQLLSGGAAVGIGGWGSLSSPCEPRAGGGLAGFGAAHAPPHQLHPKHDMLLHTSSSSMGHHVLGPRGSTSSVTTGSSISGGTPNLPLHPVGEVASDRTGQLFGGGILASRAAHHNRIEATKQELLRAVRGGAGCGSLAAWGPPKFGAELSLAPAGPQSPQLQRKVAVNFEARVQQLMRCGGGGSGGFDAKSGWGLNGVASRQDAAGGRHGGACGGHGNSSYGNNTDGVRLQALRMLRTINEPQPPWPTAPGPVPQQPVQGNGAVEMSPKSHDVHAQGVLQGWGAPLAWNFQSM
uniref:RlsG n=1 Tax=Yamagishiella unicocca TaxID=51707 RepID=A0A1W6R6K2_9CHLO|nr:RlsG [Yamagishiella unicocca]